MGLEVVEFVIALEKEMNVSIPDRDFGPLQTPRALVVYLLPRLPLRDPPSGGVARRWKQEDVEQVVERLLAKHSRRRDFDLDTDFRSMFP
jgi:hypothetical protein